MPGTSTWHVSWDLGNISISLFHKERNRIRVACNLCKVNQLVSWPADIGLNPSYDWFQSMPFPAKTPLLKTCIDLILKPKVLCGDVQETFQSWSFYFYKISRSFLPVPIPALTLLSSSIPRPLLTLLSLPYFFAFFTNKNVVILIFV